MHVHTLLRKIRGEISLIVDALSYDKNYDRPLELDRLCVSATKFR